MSRMCVCVYIYNLINNNKENRDKRSRERRE